MVVLSDSKYDRCEGGLNPAFHAGCCCCCFQTMFDAVGGWENANYKSIDTLDALVGSHWRQLTLAWTKPSTPFIASTKSAVRLSKSSIWINSILPAPCGQASGMLCPLAVDLMMPLMSLISRASRPATRTLSLQNRKLARVQLLLNSFPGSTQI